MIKVGFFISQIILLKHVYMCWKFQRTLKLGMSFSLGRFFIPVAISAQVASVCLNLALNVFSSIYENFVLLGNFKFSTDNPNLNNFMCSFHLERLIDSPTCYKSINPTCIDLILIKKKIHFMKSATFETDLFDHHKLITTTLRKNDK